MVVSGGGAGYLLLVLYRGGLLAEETDTPIREGPFVWELQYGCSVGGVSVSILLAEETDTPIREGLLCGNCSTDAPLAGRVRRN